MRTVKLEWRPRISQKKRAAIIWWMKQHYDWVKDKGEYLEIKAPNDCTKFLWIFMFAKTFRDIL